MLYLIQKNHWECHILCDSI